MKLKYSGLAAQPARGGASLELAVQEEAELALELALGVELGLLLRVERLAGVEARLQVGNPNSPRPAQRTDQAPLLPARLQPDRPQSRRFFPAQLQALPSPPRHLYQDF